jgi:hypothetical protein
MTTTSTTKRGKRRYKDEEIPDNGFILPTNGMTIVEDAGDVMPGRKRRIGLNIVKNTYTEQCRPDSLTSFA